MNNTDNSELTEKDVESIMQTSKDFIESWYTANPDRMEHSFHPKAIKRTIYYDEDEKKWDVSVTRTPKDMAKFTSDGGEKDLPDLNKTSEIEIIGAHRRTAVVKLVSHTFVDFLQLGKFDDRWLIVNDLWEKRIKK